MGNYDELQGHDPAKEEEADNPKEEEEAPAKSETVKVEKSK